MAEGPICLDIKQQENRNMDPPLIRLASEPSHLKYLKNPCSLVAKDARKVPQNKTIINAPKISDVIMLDH